MTLHKSIRPERKPKLGLLQREYIRHTSRLRRFIHGKPYQVPLEELPIRGPYHLVSDLTVYYRTPRPSHLPQLSKMFFDSTREALGEKLSRSFDHRSYAPEHLSEIIPPRNFHLITTEDGTIVGIMHHRRFSSTHADVKNLYVVKDYRGFGIGKLLVALAMQRMLEEGITTIYAFAAPMSQGIFLQLGFAETSRVMRWLSGGTVMSLSITPSDSLLPKIEEMLAEIVCHADLVPSEPVSVGQVGGGMK